MIKICRYRHENSLVVQLHIVYQFGEEKASLWQNEPRDSPWKTIYEEISEHGTCLFPDMIGCNQDLHLQEKEICLLAQA